MSPTDCQNRIDADDDESATCGDEGRRCPECFQEAAHEMAKEFGLRPGMTRAEVRDQLERMNPYHWRREQ